MTGEQDFAGQFMLEIIDGLLGSGSLSSGWGTLLLEELVYTAGIDIPEGAAGIVLDVEIQDVADGEYSLTFGYGGIVDVTNYPGRSFTIFTRPGIDEWIAKQFILPLTDDYIIDYLAAASAGTTLDYTLRLIGWIILGTDYEKPTSPQEDLPCGFTVQQ